MPNLRRLAVVTGWLATVTALAPRSAGAQGTPTPVVRREVRRNTIRSDSIPAAELVVDPAFRYIGSRALNLYDKTESEMHIFVDASADGQIKRFAWIQFERAWTQSTFSFMYAFVDRVDWGGLDFVHDARALLAYGADATTGSDFAAGLALMREAGRTLPARVQRIRLFHLPTKDRPRHVAVAPRPGADSLPPITFAGVPACSVHRAVRSRTPSLAPRSSRLPAQRRSPRRRASRASRT